MRAILIPERINAEAAN